MRHGGGACISTGISRSSSTCTEEDKPRYEYQRYLVRSTLGARIRSTEQVPRTPPEGGRYGEALVAAKTQYRVRGMIHETRHVQSTDRVNKGTHFIYSFNLRAPSPCSLSSLSSF